MAFLADGELAEQALNRASPLDREHERRVSLAPKRFHSASCAAIVAMSSPWCHAPSSSSLLG